MTIQTKGSLVAGFISDGGRPFASVGAKPTYQETPINYEKHLACSLLAACLTLLPVAGYGQTIITSLPFTITQSGKYTLQSDLTVTVTPGSGPATQFAIIALASDVVIDLNGFSIVGPQGSSVASIGIAVQGIEDVVIRNGEISGLTYGVSILNGTGITVENVRLSNNDFRGISGQGCHNALILNCKILKATTNNLSRFPNTAGYTFSADLEIRL